MLIQKAMEKARDGGYTSSQRHEPAWPLEAHAFRDLSCWEALGHTLGLTHESMWKAHWDRYMCHLTAGKTPKSFFERLPWGSPASCTPASGC